MILKKKNYWEIFKVEFQGKLKMWRVNMKGKIKYFEEKLCYNRLEE